MLIWYNIAHYNSSQLSCCLLAAVIIIDGFLKSFYDKFIIVSTYCRRHVASWMGFKRVSPSLLWIQIF